MQLAPVRKQIPQNIVTNLRDFLASATIQKRCAPYWDITQRTVVILGPGSSVGIATDYGLGGPGSNGSLP